MTSWMTTRRRKPGFGMPQVPTLEVSVQAEGQGVAAAETWLVVQQMGAVVSLIAGFEQKPGGRNLIGIHVGGVEGCCDASQ